MLSVNTPELWGGVWGLQKDGPGGESNSVHELSILAALSLQILFLFKILKLYVSKTGWIFQ